MMLWKLESRQFVSYHNGVITFNNNGRKIYFNKDQFLNFHDACQLAKLTTLRTHLLIDRNIWLHCGKSMTIVIHDRGNRFFRFSPNSWQKYIRLIHSQILHLLHDGRSSYGKRSLHNDKQFSFRHSMAALQSDGDKILRSETAHVEMDTTDEQENSSNISKRQNTNHGKSDLQRSRRHAASHPRRTTPSPGRSDIDPHFTTSMHNDSECSASL